MSRTCAPSRCLVAGLAGTSIAAEVAKRLPSSPLFAANGPFHQTKAHLTGQLRNTQDLRQRFSRYEHTILTLPE
jgi:glycerol-3-phosphate dehydrogenase